MKRFLWIATSVLLAGCGVVFAVGALEQAAKPTPEMTALLPEGALLSIEARDFGALVREWNASEEKRAWLTSDNYAAFSNSRLFTRLSLAQNEFSAAAGLPADASLLENVAGKESCLGLYDIGNLEFVYITRLDPQAIEATPLWQERGKFAQRSEAGADFYVRKDAQSSRTAAFAVSTGWLILGTREDLVAGVLDRMAGTATGNLASEEWFAEAVKQAAAGRAGAARGDLRMVLNLDKIVRTPYFRSYWVEQNITEMKQYTAAVSDLYLEGQTYREERLLVRRAAQARPALGNAVALAVLAPENAAFYAAEGAPDPEKLLASLRENLLEPRPEKAADSYSTAPSAVTAKDAGGAAQLDVAIDQAPVVARQTDAFEPLRALLIAGQPEAALTIFSSRAPQQKGVFISLQSAMVVEGALGWNEQAVQQALTQALVPGLTAGNLGVRWEQRAGGEGEYFALDGAAPLYVAVRDRQLLLANDSTLLENLLARRQKASRAAGSGDVIYEALFRHTQEQSNYNLLMAQLDLAGHRGASGRAAESANGQTPAFFSGNMASLSRVFSGVQWERVEERNAGARVTQTVTYQWAGR